MIVTTSTATATATNSVPQKSLQDKSNFKLLAFDTSGDVVSVAITDGIYSWQQQTQGGMHASTLLLPTIWNVLQESKQDFHDLDAIVFGQGPGSFTGLRTACSVAQGLAFGSQLPVLPISNLMAVAEEARHVHGLQSVTAVIDARMDELYTACFVWISNVNDIKTGHWQATSPAVLCKVNTHTITAQTAGSDFSFAIHEVHPNAATLLRLAPHLLRTGCAVQPAQAFPLYIRNQVAKTTVERAEMALLAAQNTA